MFHSSTVRQWSNMMCSNMEHHVSRPSRGSSPYWVDVPTSSWASSIHLRPQVAPLPLPLPPPLCSPRRLLSRASCVSSLASAIVASGVPLRLAAKMKHCSRKSEGHATYKCYQRKRGARGARQKMPWRGKRQRQRQAVATPPGNGSELRKPS